MPPKRGSPKPNQTAEWLRKARNELNLASGWRSLPHVDLASFAFHAHQSAEFALKAVFNHANATYPWVHDIQDLTQNLQVLGIQIRDDVWEAAILSQYYTKTRYPPFLEAVTQERLEEAIQLAQRVVTWAESVIRGGADSSAGTP